MALQGGAKNAKLKLFAIGCGILVLAIASVPSLIFAFPDWGLSSERLVGKVNPQLLYSCIWLEGGHCCSEKRFLCQWEQL